MTPSPTPSSSPLPWWTLAAGAAIAILIAAFFIVGSKPSSPESTAPADTAPTVDSPAKSASPAAPAYESIGDSDDPAEWQKRLAVAGPGNFSRLLDRALGIPDNAFRNQIVEQLTKKWIETDLSGFLEFLDNNEDESIWRSLIPALAAALPTVNDSVAASPDLDDVVQEFIAYYAESDPDKALAWADQWLLDESLETALATVSGEVARTSRPEALKILDRIKSRGGRLEAISNIASVLGETDPASAVAWAGTFTDQFERTVALENVLASLAIEQPEEAARHLQSLTGQHDDFAGVSGLIADEWASRNPAEAIRWVESLPDGEMKDEAISGALSGWAYSNPRDAFNYYLQNHASNADFAELVFEAWAAKNPSEAAREALALNSPDQRALAVSGVVSGWLENDVPTETVASWVDGLAQGRERDLASSQLVSITSLEEPEPAWRRAQTIADNALRHEALLSAFSSWIDLDADAARTALRQANLPPEQARELNDLLGSSGN
jgi:hypothetical protein